MGAFWRNFGKLEAASPVTCPSGTQNILTTEKTHCSLGGMKTVWKPLVWASSEPQIIWGSRGRRSNSQNFQKMYKNLKKFS